MGGTLVRTIGLVRVKVKIGMTNLAYNIRRLCELRHINQIRREKRSAKDANHAAHHENRSEMGRASSDLTQQPGS